MELLSLGSTLGRTSTVGTFAARGDALADLIEHWFLDAASRLSAHGLLRDYVERAETLTVVRGSVDHLSTARSLLTGTLAAHCRYEDYELDTPHNRMLRAGLAVVVRSRDEARARTASRLIGEVRAVGNVSATDWRAPFDRRSRVYEPASRRAKMLVDGTALALDNSGMAARCFLLRTAPAFEQGVRELIRIHLARRASVAPRGFVSTTGNVRFDPDIVIDTADAHTAVADVKYRDFGTDWDSGTRNQIVAFATAARSDHAAVIGIERAGKRIPRPFSLHELHVTPIGWKAWHDDPRSQLIADVEAWLIDR
jgi:5-methylcytosine-specific restriction endonuclease McrBC regulatory subunit McrC